MTKEQITAVLENVRSWPEPDQEELAEVAREILARRAGVYITTDDERQAVQNAGQSALLSADEVDAFWKRHNIG
ncbi:MAG TPA: hypothetical protein VIJ85_09760 [Rhizomicrobium sp.]